MSLNLWDLNARGVKHHSLTCVISWFLPVVSLAWPYFILSEIWKASNPETLDEEQWKLSEVSPVLWLWWLCFVLYVFGGVLSNLLAKAVARSNPADLQLLSSFYFVSFIDQLIAAAAACLGIIVVQRLTKRQEEKFLALSKITVCATSQGEVNG
jgi:hypothetical protein